VRRVVIGLVAALLVVGLGAPTVAAAPASGVPKVVLIVGPVGAATSRYRAEARDAARIARAYTSDVTEIYSPNATWPAVRRALQGASLVVYMGHGNGWPSRYRDHLYPPSQDGFGLNPAPGGDDSSHQYFGEGPIASSIRLAPNAVVLLNHLCYASGNSEPGLPEGSLATARQRVDNFAAGFIAAGAAAVVAEAYTTPDFMVRAVLGGRSSIEAAWRDAPSANGHRFAFASVRSPGYVAEMDPATRSHGFERSIVLKAGLASRDVLRDAQGRAGGPGSSGNIPAVMIPSLASTGIQLKAPVMQTAPAAGGTFWYRLPFSIADRTRLPDAVEASVRWDPLDVAPTPATTTPATDPPAVPDLGLVVPERLGDVVAPSSMKIDKARLGLRVKAPAAPGRYRLTVMLHDRSGVAFDAATQAMVRTLLVRVTGPNDAQIVAPAVVELAPGANQTVSMWVANLGRTAWGTKAVPGIRTVDNAKDVSVPVLPSTNARVFGTFVALGADDPAQVEAASTASVTPTSLPAAMAPRAIERIDLPIYGPITAGDYLLVVDILTPEVGSLAAQGVAPTVIRVHVAVPAVVPPAATPILPGAGGT
jgi:hypothetical protein